jgi:hypothetical protein
MNSKRRIALRLLKQSAVPGAIALAYMLFRHWPIAPSKGPAVLLESFIAGFFMASWFAGQILRTSKQVHDEQKFEVIISKLDKFDQKSINALKESAYDHIDMAADFAQLRTATRMLVPEYVKGMIYAMHLDRGDDPALSYVKPWEVPSEVLEESRRKLREVASRQAAAARGE